MNLYILHNVRGLCFYTLWDLLVIGICAIVVPSAKPKRQTDARSLRNVSLLGIFLLFCLQALGFALSSRFAGCFYARFRNGSAQSCATLSASGRFEAFLSARFDSAISLHMAHGPDNPQGRTCNLPCREKALESLPRCSFPDRMCANQQPRRRTGAVFIWPPERSLERGACA